MKIDYATLKLTIQELEKVGEMILAENLRNALENSEIEKPEKHNRKDDLHTSFFHISLLPNEIEKIKDLFITLEVSSLDENCESTSLTQSFVSAFDKWNV